MDSKLFVNTPPETITVEQASQFREQGFFIVPALYTPEELELMHQLRIRVETEARDNVGSYTRNGALYEVKALVNDPDGRTALRKIQEVFSSEPDFRAVAASDKILDIVEDLIGPEIYYHSSKLMCKPAKGGQRKPWHQDFAYWADMQPKQVTVWGAIDPATLENGCIQVIPGSHLKGLVEHHHAEDFMIDESLIDESDIFYAVMNPGDVLFFNVMLLHASAANMSGEPRVATIIDFDSESATDKTSGCDTPLRTADSCKKQ